MSAVERPKDTVMEDPEPYKNSTSVLKIRKRLQQKLPPRIAFLDIDSTITFSRSTIATDEVRATLEKQGYVIAFVTSRTEEIIISEAEREKSPQLNRPLPHLGIDNHGRRYYTDPLDIEPHGILDADIIISTTGTKVLYKQSSGGYFVDLDYTKKLTMNPQHWREEVLNLITELNYHRHICQPHHNEYIENYDIGKSNVAPPDFRIELKFMTLKQKKEFISIFNANVKKITLQLQMTDDSNPLKEKYTLYITPSFTTKVHAVECVVEKLSSAVPVSAEELNLFIAGDSYPDLAMGLYGGRNCNATFMLVGASRLAAYLVDEDVHEFADESLKEIKKNLVLLQSRSGGIYNFVLRGTGNRKVIIGDEAYPNTKGPETILAYLAQFNI